ncbi:hypothetical protein [Algiphilus sp.]|uniref:hypothetical protein n=1 Tax=Algiphilus sp. TaxID=1872431 RepID=UPI0025BD74E1|nr:hypothetical protein [Algiphilus sp.]MCK5772018.1 hypothetical protein [Algiphilus sp.]
MLAKLFAALGATSNRGADDAVIAHGLASPLRRTRPMLGRKSSRPRCWHEQRAARILAGSAKVGQDLEAWFRHLAYGDARPTTPDPRPHVQARRQAQIDQIIAGRRERDIERRDRNARRQGRA